MRFSRDNLRVCFYLVHRSTNPIHESSLSGVSLFIFHSQAGCQSPTRVPFRTCCRSSAALQWTSRSAGRRPPRSRGSRASRRPASRTAWTKRRSRGPQGDQGQRGGTAHGTGDARPAGDEIHGGGPVGPLLLGIYSRDTPALTTSPGVTSQIGLGNLLHALWMSSASTTLKIRHTGFCLGAPHQGRLPLSSESPQPPGPGKNGSVP